MSKSLMYIKNVKENFVIKKEDLGDQPQIELKAMKKLLSLIVKDMKENDYTPKELSQFFHQLQLECREGVL